MSVWIRNPIQLFFILSYSFFLASTIPAFFEGVAIAESLNVIWNDQLPLFSNIINVNTAFGADLLRRVGRIGLCCTISCIYVLPLIHSVRDTAKLLLIIPFSLVYFPVYMVVSIFGMAIGVRSLTFPKKSDTCGWKTT